MSDSSTLMSGLAKKYSTSSDRVMDRAAADILAAVFYARYLVNLFPL